MSARSITVTINTLGNQQMQYAFTDSAAPGKNIAANSLHSAVQMFKDVLQRASLGEIADAAHSGQ